MKLSVNILTWNNQDTIVDMLTVLKEELKDISHEYIFVDNGSTDGTKTLIFDWVEKNTNDFSIIDNPENLGISKGKNQGINISDGEYILMLDGDVVPVPNTIKLMIEWLDNNPDKVALGMQPNMFATSEDMAEASCIGIVDIKEHKCACLFYGVYRRKVFDEGLRMSEEGEFGGPGYGWEDHDFYQRLVTMGHKQYAGYINKKGGRYFHKINSSIRAMGHETYMQTSRARGKQFHEVWGA